MNTSVRICLNHISLLMYRPVLAIFRRRRCVIRFACWVYFFILLFLVKGLDREYLLPDLWCSIVKNTHTQKVVLSLVLQSMHSAKLQQHSFPSHAHTHLTCLYSLLTTKKLNSQDILRSRSEVTTPLISF